MISVYIADDEVWITIGLKKLIQKSGLPFEVIGEAHNGVTTLEDIKTLKPDVLFTDIRMPGLSGLEVMSYISEHQFATKVVLISGYAEFEYARQAMLCGAFDYLLKPIQQETLTKPCHAFEMNLSLPLLKLLKTRWKMQRSQTFRLPEPLCSKKFWLISRNTIRKNSL